MSTFESSREQFRQEHFTIIEIDLPVVNGTCTISGEPGYGTPLSCDQPSNGIKTYRFTDYGGVIPGSGIHKCIKSITENATELKPGSGLAQRATMSVTLLDKKGDPNPLAPAVTEDIKNQGTFFSKLDERFILVNNLCRRLDYRVGSDGSIDLVDGARVSYWIIESLSARKKGEWSLKLKDELSKANVGESVWPSPKGGYLRSGTTDILTTLQVDPNIDYKVDDCIRLSDELCKITSINNIQTPTASIVVQARGNDIVYTNTLSRTVKDIHQSGDEIFRCEVADNERVDDLIRRILIDIGIDSSLIPIADWAKEIDDWSIPNINTIFVESTSTSDVLNSILIPRQLDLWYDPVDREIKLAAINAWKKSEFVAEEGLSLKDNAVIDYGSVTKRKEEGLRATRAVIVYDKTFLTDSDDFSSYTRASLAKREELETSDFFGTEPKFKQFKSSSNIESTTANLLTNRYVQMNTNPYTLTWTTQERKLNFKVGQVGDIKTSSVVGFSGTPALTRGQISSIQIKNTAYGREYLCSANVFTPALESGSEQVISGTSNNLNLFILAGAPSESVTITFIFDAAIVSATDNSTPSIVAGGFAAGSKIIIILANGSDLQSIGGSGGVGAGVRSIPNKPLVPLSSPTNGGDGGVVYNAQGVDTDIYFSGATPSAAHPIADGYIRAPGGGGGGFDYTTDIELAVSGNGGGGGAGINPGLGGLFGDAEGALAEQGLIGKNGDNIGNGGSVGGGDWGEDGANNNAAGGLKGSGVIDSGAVVTFFGETSERYINGGGDH
ncbi:MAG: hypothetical protein GY928_16380 [Colwellia sp.]|nr:hypothetical protein [Colwellia sp.]